MVAYSNLNNRGYQYDISTQKNIVNVLLTVDKEDWLIRCKNTGETVIDYEKHTKAFDDAFETLKANGMHTLTFNTTHQTPYIIANLILQWMAHLEREAQDESKN